RDIGRTSDAAADRRERPLGRRARAPRLRALPRRRGGAARRGADSQAWGPESPVRPRGGGARGGGGGGARGVAAAGPQLVVHAAALSSLAACESDPARARRVNVD